MPKLNQRGVIHLIVLLILILGMIGTIYLVTKGPLNIFSKASLSKPIGPETSFTLVGPGPQDCTAGFLCSLGFIPQPQLRQEFSVQVYARSDIETANLFEAKMNFPKDLVEVKEIQTKSDFIKNWVETYYDNNTGEISLVGGVPDPGYQTQTGGQSGLMATIVFKAKKIGKGPISFKDSSAIYSNLNSINILTIKRPYEISVEVKPSPPPVSGPITVPSPKPTSVPVSSTRVFVTSTTYNGNLGGLSGADAKCQDRASAANLGGTWKAWLSDNTTSAASRLVHSSNPYKLLDGVIIANNWTDLTDGSLQRPITITETKSFNGNYVYSGTRDNGDIMNPGTGKCANWTSSTEVNGPGLLGHSGRVDYQWSWGTSYHCSYKYPLYCFEQTSSTTPTPIPGTGDANKDGKINLVDLSILLADFNKNQGIRTSIDMNGDGDINVFDFSLMIELLIRKGVVRR